MKNTSRHFAARRRSCMVLLVFLIFDSEKCLGFLAPYNPIILQEKKFSNRLYSREPSYWEDNDDSSGEIFNEREYDEILEWESCNSNGGVAQVLLPPRAVKLPTAVVHFCGGTFFGSAPNVWYKQLLQDLVQQTNVAVVATSVPVTLLQSPLDHVMLAKQIEEQFVTAWEQVIVDEYGSDNVKNLPICGMGHSLGARLLVVLATLRADKNKAMTTDYKAHILICFTNFGAAAGIPGIGQLSRASLRQEKQKPEMDSDKQRRRRAEDWYGDDSYDLDDDEEWEELVDNLQNTIRSQATRVKSALTPNTKDLEFRPSPDQLWKALLFDMRYKIPRTLVVQFDRDDIDQTSKLANSIQNQTDVKFARLRGSHLTPVSGSSDMQQMDSSWFQQLNTGALKAVNALLSGQLKTQSHDGEIRELRQSVKRYITEVVTK